MDWDTAPPKVGAEELVAWDPTPPKIGAGVLVDWDPAPPKIGAGVLVDWEPNAGAEELVAWDPVPPKIGAGVLVDWEPNVNAEVFPVAAASAPNPVDTVPVVKVKGLVVDELADDVVPRPRFRGWEVVSLGLNRFTLGAGTKGLFIGTESEKEQQ